jgi:hypothetical protein
MLIVDMSIYQTHIEEWGNEEVFFQILISSHIKNWSYHLLQVIFKTLIRDVLFGKHLYNVLLQYIRSSDCFMSYVQ